MSLFKYGVFEIEIDFTDVDMLESIENAYEKMQEDVKNLPIIAMTANALEEDKAAALKNGMNAHLSKPLDMGTFIALLQKFVK